VEIRDRIFSIIGSKTLYLITSNTAKNSNSVGMEYGAITKIEMGYGQEHSAINALPILSFRAVSGGLGAPKGKTGRDYDRLAVAIHDILRTFNN
jgi:hypothetical protein